MLVGVIALYLGGSLRCTLTPKTSRTPAIGVDPLKNRHQPSRPESSPNSKTGSCCHLRMRYCLKPRAMKDTMAMGESVMDALQELVGFGRNRIVEKPNVHYGGNPPPGVKQT